MTVLRVTCWLGSQVASREQVHLDGVLMAVHPDCGVHLTRQTPIAQVRNPLLPIASLPYDGPMRVPLCSAWQLGPDVRAGLERIVKRKDPTDIEHRARPWTPSSGPEKNCMLPVPTALAPSVSWTCVGNRRGVLELLRYVRQIGAIRRHGYGIVQGWDVEAVDESPLSAVVDGEGRARRFLPLSWCDDAESSEIGPVAPPYWHPGMQVPRVRPGARITLRPEIVARIMQCR